MFKKIRKNDKGFTLVEVIVVAVIVAVLAAVAIPLYLNYITNSRDNSAANVAGSIATFCASCENGAGTVGGLTVAEKTGPYSITCTNGAGDGTTMSVPSDMKTATTSLVSPATVTVTHTATGATGQTASW